MACVGSEGEGEGGGGGGGWAAVGRGIANSRVSAGCRKRRSSSSEARSCEVLSA